MAFPVYTGNTVRRNHTKWNSPVYPCVYREHKKNSITFKPVNGLSLCVQGTPHALPQLQLQLRFIPVCTGNTPIRWLLFVLTPVYPCVYREHSNYNILFYN